MEGWNLPRINALLSSFDSQEVWELFGLEEDGIVEKIFAVKILIIGMLGYLKLGLL
jgi:hypothetical protein